MERKRVVNKILVLLSVVFVLCAVAIPVCAESIDLSGKCGSKLTWELKGSSGDLVLTISGTGAMDNYYQNSSQPWGNYKSSIKKVVLEEGMTST